MEYFSPEDKLSLQRILFYGRGGFDVIDPRHFPYRQPDFRDPEIIRATVDSPIPFMLLLRRMGRERQARLPLTEAAAVMRLLYDDFACFCTPEHIRTSLDVVLQRLDERRAKGLTDVALLPLPTGPKNLQRLRRLFRYDVYQRYYAGAAGTEAYLAAMRERLAASPRFFDESLAQIASELERTPRSVYGSRDQRFLVDAMPALLVESDDAAARPEVPQASEPTAPGGGSKPGAAPEPRPAATRPHPASLSSEPTAPDLEPAAAEANALAESNPLAEANAPVSGPRPSVPKQGTD
jgi:hypothetical protein